MSDALLVNTLLKTIGASQTVFVGFDSDDSFFSVDNRSSIDKLFPTLTIQWVEMQPDPGNVVAVWNTLAQTALHQGFEYFMVLGDDIELPQTNWLETFVKQLHSQMDVGWVAGWFRLAAGELEHAAAC